MLTLEECVAKADQLCDIPRADPLWRTMVQAWGKQPHFHPLTPSSVVISGLASFLNKPLGDNFPLITRAWCKDFNRFYIDLLTERLKG